MVNSRDVNFIGLENENDANGLTIIEYAIIIMFLCYRSRNNLVMKWYFPCVLINITDGSYVGY